MRMFAAVVCVAVGCILGVAPAGAQSGIQWSGNARASIERARESYLPLMFWITERTDFDDDAADDLKDAQQDAFRDPVVLGIVERYYVPCRVARNSNVLAEAERMGLPTNFGLYVALITPDGRVLDQIDPGQVASPEALAARLAAASKSYRDSVYQEKCRRPITDLSAPKAEVRRAVKAAWRMRVYSADQDLVGLLAREDLTDPERSRLYQLFSAFGTGPCVEALLALPEEKVAQAALVRAEPAAIPTLVGALPHTSGEVSAREAAAYRALVAVAKVRGEKDDGFWKSATAEERGREIERVKGTAEAVYGAWEEREGKWR